MRRWYVYFWQGLEWIARFLWVMLAVFSINASYVRAAIQLYEVMPNTSDDTNLEYIALRNVSCVPEVLSGHTLSDASGKTFSIPSMTFEPGEVKKFFHPETKITLNNTDETIFFSTGNGGNLGSFSYKTSTKWVAITINTDTLPMCPSPAPSNPLPSAPDSGSGDSSNAPSPINTSGSSEFSIPITSGTISGGNGGAGISSGTIVGTGASVTSWGGQALDSTGTLSGTGAWTTSITWDGSGSSTTSFTWSITSSGVTIGDTGTQTGTSSSFPSSSSAGTQSGTTSFPSSIATQSGTTTSSPSTPSSGSTTTNSWSSLIGTSSSWTPSSSLPYARIHVQSGLNENFECFRDDCVVNFSFEAATSATKCSWNFAGGQFGASDTLKCNPSYVHYPKGEYTVTLQVCNTAMADCTSDTITLRNYGTPSSVSVASESSSTSSPVSVITSTPPSSGSAPWILSTGSTPVTSSTSTPQKASTPKPALAPPTWFVISATDATLDSHGIFRVTCKTDECKQTIHIRVVPEDLLDTHETVWYLPTGIRWGQSLKQVPIPKTGLPLRVRMVEMATGKYFETSYRIIRGGVEEDEAWIDATSTKKSTTLASTKESTTSKIPSATKKTTTSTKTSSDTTTSSGKTASSLKTSTKTASSNPQESKTSEQNSDSSTSPILPVVIVLCITFAFGIGVFLAGRMQNNREILPSETETNESSSIPSAKAILSLLRK